MFPTFPTGKLRQYCMILSERYDVTDFKYVDTGIQGTASNIWSNISNLLRQSDGTVFTNENATGWTSTYFKPNNSQYIPLTDGLTFEFDLLDYTTGNNGQFRVSFYDANTNPYYILAQTGHYKFVFSDKIYATLDGVSLGEPFSYDTSISTIQIGLIDTNKYVSIKFKNFGYY